MKFWRRRNGRKCGPFQIPRCKDREPDCLYYYHCQIFMSPILFGSKDRLPCGDPVGVHSRSIPVLGICRWRRGAAVWPWFLVTPANIGSMVGSASHCWFLEEMLAREIPVWRDRRIPSGSCQMSAIYAAQCCPCVRLIPQDDAVVWVVREGARARARTHTHTHKHTTHVHTLLSLLNICPNLAP